jgi:hypothetical protein
VAGFAAELLAGFAVKSLAGFAVKSGLFSKMPTSGGWVSREIFGWFSCETWLGLLRNTQY